MMNVIIVYYYYIIINIVLSFLKYFYKQIL